jgi:hypothetical protein
VYRGEARQTVLWLRLKVAIRCAHSPQARKHIPEQFKLVELFGYVLQQACAAGWLARTAAHTCVLLKICIQQARTVHATPCICSVDTLHRHTLGGFYLARYEDSPVGAFEELVILAGLVWNPPTSCAWASRVYVNNKCVGVSTRCLK